MNPVTADSIRCDRESIQRLHEWAAKLPDKKLRNEYDEWLDYYANRVNDAEANLRAGTNPKDDRMEQIHRDMAAARLLGKVVPDPPRFVCKEDRKK